MEFEVFYSIGATILIVVFTFVWFAFPIWRDRVLFAGKGRWMFWLSVLFIIGVVGLLALIARAFDADTILSSEQLGAGGNRLRAIISQFADPGNLPSSNGAGQTMALISAFSGVLCLSGLLVSSLVSVISRKTDRWRGGEIHYRFPFRSFVVIIGSNEQAAAIIKESLKKRGVRYVLIQTRKEVGKERLKLELKLDRKEEKRVVFYAGERTSSEDIKALEIHKAREVFILGEDMQSDNEWDHDAFNINCLELISSSISKQRRSVRKGKKLRCYVDLEYQGTYTVFKSTQIYSTLDEHVEFIPFNVHEVWAKKVLIDNYAVVPAGVSGESKVYRYLPLDGEEGIGYDSEKTVHLIVLGMNQMGTALAMQAAMLLHFPNYESDPAVKRRTTITFIDDQAVKESEFLMGRFAALFELARYRVISKPEDITGTDWTDPMRNGRYKHLGENFMDIQWEFIQGNVASSDVKRYMCSVAEDKSKITTIAVCFNNPQQSIATAVYLPEIVLKRVSQVLVYQQNSFDLVTKVSTGEKQWKRYAKLHPFGMIEGSYKGGRIGSETAQLTHYLYKKRGLPRNLDEDFKKVEQYWWELGLVDKLSNVDVADTYPLKMRSMPDREAVFADESVFRHYRHAEHNRWLTERLTFGFRPLDFEEREVLRTKGTDKEKEREKRRLIAKYRAHLDICSNSDIEIFDPGTRENETLILENIENLFDLQYKMILRRTQRNRIPVFGRRSDVQEFLGKNNMVNIGHFSIGRTPVTQAQWERIMGKESNGSGHRVMNWLKCKSPVENVSWDDVQDFICILNDRTGLNFRLPTWPEWRLAATAGRVSSRGPVCSKNPNRPLKKTKPIGHYVNALGLKDILGNVWEWTVSPYLPGEETRVVQEDVTVDSEEVRMPGRQRGRIVREKSFWYCGGSWRFGMNESNINSDCWKRNWIRSFRSPDLGFRLALPFGIERVMPDLERDLSQGEKRFEQCLLFGSLKDSREMITVYRKKSEQDDTPVPWFRIGRTPVTQIQWKIVMGETENSSSFRGDDLPVENVSYKDVQRFIKKLNRLGIGLYRLPTVEEWEYVARGGYHAKDYVYAGSNDVRDVAWYYEDARSTRPVAKKAPVNLSIGEVSDKDNVYDMSGNVWEWCSDWKGKEKNSRILKGGSWRMDETYAQISYSTDCIEEYKADDVGFRLVMELDDVRK